jgi:hypothetical protein
MLDDDKTGGSNTPETEELEKMKNSIDSDMVIKDDESQQLDPAKKISDPCTSAIATDESGDKVTKTASKKKKPLLKLALGMDNVCLVYHDRVGTKGLEFSKMEFALRAKYDGAATNKYKGPIAGRGKSVRSC